MFMIDGVEKLVKWFYIIVLLFIEQYYFEVIIKCEEFGVVFCYMYDVVNVGDMFLIKVFGGKFYFNG